MFSPSGNPEPSLEPQITHMIQSKKIIKSLVLIITDLSVKSREAISVDFLLQERKTNQADFVGKPEIKQEIRNAPWRRVRSRGPLS